MTVRNCIANAVAAASFSDGDIDKIKTCKQLSIQVASEFWGFRGCVVQHFALLGCDPSTQRQAELFKITYQKKKRPSFGGANARDPRCSPLPCSIAVLDVSYDGF